MVSWWTIAGLACTFFCGKLFGRRDLASGSANDRFAIFYSDVPTTLNLTGMDVETNGIASNTTAVFKFADGSSTVGNLTGHSAEFKNGIGYGNFSFEGAEGQWITVDLDHGSKDVAEFFEWLVVATADGNVTAAEFKQAVDIIQQEGEAPETDETDGARPGGKLAAKSS